MLNHSKKHPSLLFIHLAKNAGKSVCHSLQIDKEFHPKDLNQTVLPGLDIRNSYTKEQWDTLTKFTIVRNPWDRMVSLYYFRKQQNDLLIKRFEEGLWTVKSGDISQKEWSFKKWILDPKNIASYLDSFGIFLDYKLRLKENIKYNTFFRINSEFVNQIDLISDLDGCLLVDYIIEFSNLKPELDNMFKSLGLPLLDLPIKNSSKHKNYREYYDKETKEFVEILFNKDIKYFNYEF